MDQPESISDRQPVSIVELLAWLAQSIPADPAQDLAPLAHHLTTLELAALEPARHHRILDLFHDRAHRIADALKARLRDAVLPPETATRALATSLVEVLDRIAAAYDRVLREAGERLVRNQRRNPSIVAGRALRSLADALYASWMISSTAPAQLWHRAHGLARVARTYHESQPGAAAAPGGGSAAEITYKAMLALAAAQPEGFAPAGIGLASDYLARFSIAADLLMAEPQDADGAWYWLDTERDMAPVPSGRRIPPQHGELLYVSFGRLARLLGEQISALESGLPAGNLRLPEEAAGHPGRAALKRLQAHWAAPPHREHVRRHTSYRTQICIGLDELWHLLERGEAPHGAQTHVAHATEWMVLNESPGGFSVMHVAGEVEGLSPGSILALRAAPDNPWSICVVRWLKSENPEHIELGLELVAPAARSVQLVFRNGDSGQRPTPGLLLPAIPALREHPALLAPAGAYSARRFFIVSGEETTHVTQGRLLSLDMQTGSVELFQFEPDPYPM